MSAPSNDPNPCSPGRLSRAQQLTLNTWRLAAAKLARVLDPCSVLEQAALHAALGALRDIDASLALFQRHAQAGPEFSVIGSLVYVPGRDDLAYDILDAAFLLRWNELVAGGMGPEELPPLRPQSPAASRQARPDPSPPGGLVLERLPSGELAWLCPEIERVRLTDLGRRALAMDALFGRWWPSVAEAGAEVSG